MSTGRIINKDASSKAQPPQLAFVSDGTLNYPADHPEYIGGVQPNGMLLLNLMNNEYSEFKVDTDRDCTITLFNHNNGARYKLFIYRRTDQGINLTFSDTLTYVIPGVAEGEAVKLMLLNIEVAELNGILINKIGATPEGVDAVISALNTNSIKLSETIVFNGVSQGSYANGSSMNQGDNLTTILRNMAQVALPVTYSAPSLNITPNNTSVEAGTMVNPTIIPTFTQRDGGALNRYLLLLSVGGASAVTLVDNATLQNYEQGSIQVEDGAHLQYAANAYYDDGAIKLNNMGEPSPDGQILAGSKSDTLTYTGYRKLFYGADTQGAAPTTSAAVRALANNSLNPVNGTSFNLNIPVGTTRVVVAYDAALRDLTSVKYEEVGRNEVADTFVKTTVQVEGANGFTAKEYKVYTYAPAIPFGSAATYNVTI